MAWSLVDPKKPHPILPPSHCVTPGKILSPLWACFFTYCTVRILATLGCFGYFAELAVYDCVMLSTEGALKRDPKRKEI